MSIRRRDFILGSAAGAASVATSALSSVSCQRPATAEKPYRHIDPARCLGCGECVSLCPMSAILSEGGETWIEPAECAECGTCSRSRVCPADAIRPGVLEWPRTLREAFSNPLVAHRRTGVPGRGTEGIKTNDVTERYGPGYMGVFVELGRPALGTRFVDVERVVKKFRARGYPVLSDNPVAELIADPATGALEPEILDEKAISVLAEFLLPQSAVSELESMLDQLAGEVETVFSVSVALRAAPDGSSPFRELFGPGAFSLPNGKVNVGLAQGIAAKEG
ncbi:MAG: 4Fe-4S dicluster domain-containing protein [bacterium]